MSQQCISYITSQTHLINNKPAAAYKQDVVTTCEHMVTTLETFSIFIDADDPSEEFDAAFALVELGVAKIVYTGIHEGMWLTRQ